jgi:predicted dithiol-disulfide oxidoreductase (DUF899 family)
MSKNQIQTPESVSQAETEFATNATLSHRVVSRDEWLKARTALLAKEKAFTRSRDQLTAEQRALPWVRVEKDYVFDGPSGKVALAQLFSGRSQLFIKHFMMGPGQTRQCVGCSFVRERMGWHFTWVSSYHSDFNYDFNVSFRPEQIAAGTAFYNFHQTNPGLEDLSGDSVFFKNDAGQIFHTYSTYGPGGEEFLGAYRYLDVTPKGRNENGPYHSLGDWVRPKNMYGKGGMVEGNGRYHAPECGCAVHK